MLQAVHSYDVGEAFRLALVSDARGAFNVAAEPVLGPDELAGLFGARRLTVPERALRTAASISYKLRLQPSEPGWLDMGLGAPLMDTTRIRRSSAGGPAHLRAGARGTAGRAAPGRRSRHAAAGGRQRRPLRVREFAGGVGARLRTHRVPETGYWTAMPGENVEIVHRACAAFNRGDVEATLADVDPDFEYVTAGTIPDLSGTYRGIDRFKSFIRALWEAPHGAGGCARGGRARRRREHLQ